MGYAFLINSILLGIGLAMDAFSVSIVNGIAEPDMRTKRVLLIAGTFAFFQALNPMLGYIAVHTVVGYLRALEGFLPVVALILLACIGGKMIWSGIKCARCKRGKHVGPCKEPVCLSDENGRLTFKALFVQGVATSIDALSVGFTIAEYDYTEAIVCALIIALVTLVICIGGLKFGKRAGKLLADRAQVVGGVILIFIGLEICLVHII